MTQKDWSWPELYPGWVQTVQSCCSLHPQRHRAQQKTLDCQWEAADGTAPSRMPFLLLSLVIHCFKFESHFFYVNISFEWFKNAAFSFQDVDTLCASPLLLLHSPQQRYHPLTPIKQSMFSSRDEAAVQPTFIYRNLKKYHHQFNCKY